MKALTSSKKRDTYAFTLSIYRIKSDIFFAYIKIIVIYLLFILSLHLPLQFKAIKMKSRMIQKRNLWSS